MGAQCKPKSMETETSHAPFSMPDYMPVELAARGLPTASKSRLLSVFRPGCAAFRLRTLCCMALIDGLTGAGLFARLRRPKRHACITRC